MDHQTPHTSPDGIVTFPVEHAEAPGGVLVCRDFAGTVYSQFKVDHDRVGCPAILRADGRDLDRIIHAPSGIFNAALRSITRRVPVGLPR